MNSTPNINILAMQAQIGLTAVNQAMEDRKRREEEEKARVKAAWRALCCMGTKKPGGGANAPGARPSQLGPPGRRGPPASSSLPATVRRSSPAGFRPSTAGPSQPARR